MLDPTATSEEILKTPTEHLLITCSDTNSFQMQQDNVIFCCGRGNGRYYNPDAIKYFSDGHRGSRSEEK